MKLQREHGLLFWGTCLHCSRTTGCRHVVKFALVLAIIVMSGIVSAPPVQAQTLTVLHSFGGEDGANPLGGLVRDAAGNLYGTTYSGGAHGDGLVFKLDTAGNEIVLHNFDGEDGANPVAGLVRDAAGNLYGTTISGGAYGDGTVFKLDTTDMETVLHSFGGAPTDGADPDTDLVFDKAGNLYGTTNEGGDSGVGTVFKLDTTDMETVLHSFGGAPTDGAYPYAGLVLDTAGNLYGTTGYGGASDCPLSEPPSCGTVFKLDATGNEIVLFSLEGGSDGDFPLAGLVRDAAGNLYGTTYWGGANSVKCPEVRKHYRGCGVVFELNTTDWKETVLYTFTGGVDGRYPHSRLLRDAAGNLYGTTVLGGASGAGTIFKLNTTDGQETVLYSFTVEDGAMPEAGLVRDAAGNLYGTTYTGGAYGKGTIFKLTP